MVSCSRLSHLSNNSLQFLWSAEDMSDIAYGLWSMYVLTIPNYAKNSLQWKILQLPTNFPNLSIPPAHPNGNPMKSPPSWEWGHKNAKLYAPKVLSVIYSVMLRIHAQIQSLKTVVLHQRNTWPLLRFTSQSLPVHHPDERRWFSTGGVHNALA